MGNAMSGHKIGDGEAKACDLTYKADMRYNIQTIDTDAPQPAPPPPRASIAAPRPPLASPPRRPSTSRRRGPSPPRALPSPLLRANRAGAPLLSTRAAAAPRLPTAPLPLAGEAPPLHLHQKPSLVYEGNFVGGRQLSWFMDAYEHNATWWLTSRQVREKQQWESGAQVINGDLQKINQTCDLNEAHSFSQLLSTTTC
uniref:Uncharacterized protein n=1 Tax=Oryza rufipogon TaxID=4529 RepID=A0A0E0MWE3_ORYRU